MLCFYNPVCYVTNQINRLNCETHLPVYLVCLQVVPATARCPEARTHTDFPTLQPTDNREQQRDLMHPTRGFCFIVREQQKVVCVCTCCEVWCFLPDTWATDLRPAPSHVHTLGLTHTCTQFLSLSCQSTELFFFFLVFRSRKRLWREETVVSDLFQNSFYKWAWMLCHSLCWLIELKVTSYNSNTNLLPKNSLSVHKL